MEAGLRAFIDGTLADERAARINYFEIVGVSRELEGRPAEVLRAYAEMIAGQAAELEPGRRPRATDVDLPRPHSSARPMG